MAQDFMATMGLSQEILTPMHVAGHVLGPEFTVE